MHADQTPAELNDAQGQLLIRLARKTIMAELGQIADVEATEVLHAALSDNRLNTSGGTFVTLTMDNQLRGCIGTLTASEPLAESIRNNALNAAFHDYRFSPLNAREISRVSVEVSILSEPQPLEYSDGDDLIAKLNAHVDGVIIRRGAASATFLPQVWKQLPQPEDFLSHLCQKAGLSSDAWRETALVVSTYRVQSFEE